MKSLKKLNTFLLENHPLLWHSRFFQLTISAAIMWIIAAFVGYIGVNLLVLRDQRISNWYFESGFVFFHVALSIIILAAWALQFYKNNAFKSFYPIDRLYFHKLLLLLFIPFLFLISAIIPFNFGARSKMKTLLSANTLEKDYETIHLAEAFIPTNSSNYHISNKMYPGPFPLSEISYRKGDEKWDEEYLKIRVKDTLTGEFTFKEYDYNSKYTTKIEGHSFQFFKEKLYPISACNSQWLIDKNYVFDEEKDKLQLHSIWNYGSSNIIDFNLPFMDKFQKKDFRKFYAPKVHQIAHDKDWKEIDKIIQNTVAVFNKYQVHHTISAPALIQYLKEKDFKKLESIVKMYTIYDDELEKALRQNNMSFFDYEKLSFIDKMEFHPTQYFEKDEVYSFYRNFNENYKPLLDFDGIVFFLFFALALSLVLVYFQIVKPIPFLLSIPVWGVLFIAIGLYFAFSRSHSFRAIYFLMPFILLFAIVQITNLLLLRSSKGKAVLNIVICMSILSAGFLLPLGQGVINYLSKTKVYDSCGGYDYHYFMNGFLVSPIGIWLGAFVGIILALFLAKPWLAKQNSN